MANLYPLGKKHLASWPEHYQEDFGLQSKEEYFDVVHNKRFPYLKGKWEEKEPDLTICFGKTFWSDFHTVFEIEADPEQNGFCIYPDEGIILTPFFWPPVMSDDMIRKLYNYSNNILTKEG